jgi:hypothetical protein
MNQPTNRNATYAFDNGRNERLRHVRYEDLMRVVGHYIDEHGYSDVVVTQIPDGMLLKGIVIDRTARGATERIAAVVFTNDDILALLEESAKRRGTTGQLRSPGSLPHGD